MKAEFESIGFSKSKSAPCIFTAKDRILICYVDDLIILPKMKFALDELKAKRNMKLMTKNLGFRKQFSGIQLK